MRAGLVPVKGLDAGKSRLLGALDREATRALTLAMLDDLLEALTSAPELDRVAVVTPDAEVGAHAEAAGALALVRDDPGLNPSLDAGGAELERLGARALLVVLGDVAGASREDVAALFAALDGLGGRGVVLVPARDGGTAALLRVPPGAIPNRFGPGSGAAHARAAREAGVPFASVEPGALAIDLDRPEDLEALLRSRAPAARTRALLARLGVGAPR